MKKNQSLKVALVNIAFISISIVCLELAYRLITQAKIDTSKPIPSLKSVARALLNKKWSYYNQSDIHRMPYPYMMFKGAPNIAGHNNLGYKISDPATLDTINIALFGGSTGYNGKPPIINLITEELNAHKGASTYKPINFSVVSSNHNQHLHSLIENYTKYPLDIIVFYGGYNETLTTAFYDPRPGFPYNFRIRNEMSPEEMLLSKHVALYDLKLKYLDKPTIEPFSSKWNEDIVKNYMHTINTAKLLSAPFTTGRCKTPFIFAYQPYQMTESYGVPKTFKRQVHDKIRSFTTSSATGIDVSDTFASNASEYTDIVHLTQKGREAVARKILESKVFKDAIRSCSA